MEFYRNLTLTFALLLIAILAAETPVVAQVSTTPLCTVTTSALNLRPQDSTRGRPVQVLRRGAELVPLARNSSGAWIAVEVISGGERGWISASGDFVDCSIDLSELPEGDTDTQPAQSGSDSGQATAQEADEELADAVCTVTASALNLRPRDNPRGRPLQVLTRDTELLPLAQNSGGTWIAVEVASDGERGWISANDNYVDCSIDLDNLPEGDTDSEPIQVDASSQEREDQEEASDDTDPEPSSAESTNEIEAPVAVGYQSDTFSWEWEGDSPADEVDWYFDIKIYADIDATIPYDVKVAEVVEVQTVGDTYRFRKPIRQFACGSHWVVQIAERDEEGNYVGPLSDESNRKATNRGCRGSGSFSGKGGGDDGGGGDFCETGGTMC